MPVFTADNDALAERWRLRIKGEILFERGNDSTAAEAIAFLQARYDNCALHIRCLTEDCAQATYLHLLCRLDDEEQGYWSPAPLDAFRTIVSLRGPKYMFPMSLGIARNGVTRLRSVRSFAKMTPENCESWLDREVVAMRSAGQTHHLVGVCKYEFQSLQRALDAICKTDEVILELKHPQTKERTSLALTLPKRTEQYWSWSYASPLKLADDSTAGGPAAKSLSLPANRGMQ